MAEAAIAGERVKSRCRLVVDSNRGVSVGTTFVGPGIVEAIHSAVVAIAGEVPVSRLPHPVPSFPTVGEV